MSFISSIFNKVLSNRIKNSAQELSLNIENSINDGARLSIQQLVHASRFLDSRMV